MSAHPLSSVLVANRGEIARRVFRTARAMGLRCVAVYVDADADSPFVAEADEAVRLPSGYLDGPGVVAAALVAGAEAIHPGYGFLSENAAFAADVAAAGLTWVGPPPEVIDRVARELGAACKDAGFAERLSKIGVDPVCSSPAEFGQAVRQDLELWKDAVRAAGIKPPQ